MELDLLEYKLVNGREIFLPAVFVTITYDALEYDDESERANRMTIQNFVHSSKRIWPHSPFVLLGENDYLANLSHPLPKLFFVGDFRSISPVKDLDFDGSHAAIGWLQDEYTPIMSTRNLNYLKNFEWGKIAQNFYY